MEMAAQLFRVAPLHIFNTLEKQLDIVYKLYYNAFSNTKWQRGEYMEDKILQQLKKGVLEMLVLNIICKKTTYGYELMAELKKQSHDLFTLKEGTLYPILYRLEDEGMIESSWSPGEGKVSPKKMYTATDKGRQEAKRRFQVWQIFSRTVNEFYQED